MALEPFTDNDSVRGVLGVNAQELSDDTLALEMYALGLKAELNAVGEPDNDGALVAAFETILLIEEATRTAPQRNLYAAVILFAPYAVARHLASSFPLFTQRSITDGKAAVSRHAESPFKDAINQCKQDYERFRQSLEKRWATYVSIDAVLEAAPTLVVISSPSTDPVTTGP